MKPKNPEMAWSYAIASLIREHWYVGGKEPKGWSIGRDLRVAKYFMVTQKRTDLEEAIRGLRMIYNDGRHLDMRYFTSKKSRFGVQLYNRAVQTFRQGEKRGDSRGLAKLGIEVRKPAA